MLGPGLLRHINEIAQRGQRRQLRLQGQRLLRREAGQLELDLADPVGRQHAGAATIGHHSKAAPDRAIARGQTLGRREQRHKGAYPHRTSPAQGRIKHIVTPHNGARMRQRSPVTRCFAPRLEHHHRLGVGRSPQRTHEAAGVGDALHVDHDAVGVRIGGQKVQHLGQIHRRIGAQRHHGGKTHTVLLRPIQDRRRQGARLRHQRQRTRRAQGPGHTGVEVEVRALETQAIGAQQVNVIAPGNAVQFGRQGSVNTAGNHQCSPAIDAPHDLQGRHHLGGRHGNDGQVSLRVGQIGQGAAVVHVQKGQRARKPLRHQGAMQGLGLARLGGRFIRFACQNGYGAG